MSEITEALDAFRREHPLTLEEARKLRRVLRSYSDEQLHEVAQQTARLRPLSPLPNWTFGSFAESEEPDIFVRKLVWTECRERRLPPIVFPWHYDSRVYVHLGNDLSHPTFLGGCIEPNEFAFLDRMLHAGATFIDIGANEGFFTVFAAAKIGAAGRVLSFEPSSREVSRLRANVAINAFENVTIIQSAVADRNGTATLKIAETDHEGQNTLGDFVWAVRATDHEEVKLARLDDEVARLQIEAIDVMKIDVEGAEMKVLRGAEEMLTLLRPIILLELSPRALELQGDSAPELRDYLRTKGYRMFGFDPLSGLCDVPDGESDNVAAIPAEKCVGGRPRIP